MIYPDPRDIVFPHSPVTILISEIDNSVTLNEKSIRSINIFVRNSTPFVSSVSSESQYN